ncbi:MAG: hypothetical protein ACXAC5_06075 [Promethearchaeota archaeon]|jgi:hypothetical protein
MILNDLKVKVDGNFSKEIVIEDDGEELVYVFPDTKEFISILKRKLNKEIVSK